MWNGVFSSAFLIFQIFRKRYLTSNHYVAYMLDPTKRRYKLTEKEKANLKMSTQIYDNIGLLSLIIKLQADCCGSLSHFSYFSVMEWGK